MAEKPLIGVLCYNLASISSQEFSTDLPIDLIRFTVGGINWINRTVKGSILEKGRWKPSVSRFPDAVYNRHYTDSQIIPKGLERIIGKGKIFNTLTLFNKHMVFSILSKSNLRNLMIPTYPYDSGVLLDRLSQERSVLIKPMEGTRGENVHRITIENNEYRVYPQTQYFYETLKTAGDLVNHMEAIVGFQKQYVIQPFISFATLKDRLFDIRMLVQKNHQGRRV